MSYVYRDRRTKARPWCLAYKGLDGRLHREKTEAPTKELAKRLLARKVVGLAEARVAGVTEERNPILFDDFVPLYLKHAHAVKTRQAAARDVTALQHLLRVFGGKPLGQIRAGDVQAYVDCRIRQPKQKPNPPKDGSATAGPLRPRTVNIETNTLSAIFREAIKRGFVDKNPASGIRRLPEENIIVRYLSHDEEKRLIEACSPALHPFVVLALHTGMRLGELLHLEWKDVDFEQRLIRVKLTKSHRTRYLPMNSRAHELLNGLPRRSDIELVFFNPKSSRHWTWTHAPGWRKAIRNSGIKEFRFQDLRHTFASRLVQSAVSIKVVQELLGHANVSTTMRYAHLAPAALRKAVDILASSDDKSAERREEPEARDKA